MCKIQDVREFQAFIRTRVKIPETMLQSESDRLLNRAGDQMFSVRSISTQEIDAEIVTRPRENGSLRVGTHLHIPRELFDTAYFEVIRV